jgi:hypothetical protein
VGKAAPKIAVVFDERVFIKIDLSEAVIYFVGASFTQCPDRS